ncbi:MAG: T9SS type A sorting domain-containing protein [Crocinitomicaceae bacterium]|nr:T9SS type A sorting domain-containing protein [Crocinitomicaceae bacterium]
MNSTNKLLLLLILLIATFYSYAQRGKDGDVTISLANTVVNTYTHLTANPTSNILTVQNNAMTGGTFGGVLAPGDLVMIIQMQGSGADIADIIGCCGGISASSFSNFWDWWTVYQVFGEVTNPNGSGKWEIQEVAGVTGSNLIRLQCNVSGSYDHTDHVQVVRIPRYNNLTVNAGINSIIPDQWDGNSGGVVALEVDGILNIASGSSISASGFGFRGGQLDPNGLSGGTINPTEDRYPGTNDSFHAGEKGESIFGYHAEYDARNTRYGRGAAANGGGGGSHQNCGGGGGSNVSPTTTGFTGNGVPTGAAGPWNLEATPIGGTNSPGGGRGGYAYSNLNQNELTTGPDNAAWGGDARKDNGGLGGHPLAYDPTRIFFGGGGGAGDQDSDEGGAGGNGGGIVYIQSFGTITGNGTIEANGGDGQNTNPNNNPVNFSNLRRGNDGAGGAGGGGSIYIENATVIPNTISLIANGGNGGNQNLTLAPGQTPEAGGPGGGGGGGYIAFNGGSPTQSVLGGANGISNSAHVSNFPQNGATAGNVGISNLPSKYYDLTISDVTICENTSTNLTVNVLGTLPSGSTINWYDAQFGFDATPLGSGSSFNTGILTATTTYYIGICPGPTNFRVPVTVNITPEDDPSFTLTMACPGGISSISSVISGLMGGAFTFNPDPMDGSILDAATGAVTGTNTGTTYNILYTTNGTCPANSAQSILVACPLPIDLMYFDAKPTTQSTVDITWATLSEQNSDYFTIEKSLDGINWEELMQVDGGGNSNDVLNYLAEDLRPHIGTSYYRLKQVDYNGDYTYSDIKPVTFSSEFNVIVFPNPTTGEVQIVGSETELNSISIFDATGRNITHLIELNRDSDISIKLNLSELSNGIYNIQTSSQMKRIVKQ